MKKRNKQTYVQTNKLHYMQIQYTIHTVTYHSKLRTTSSLSTFRNRLKTHFFTAAYRPTWRDITHSASVSCP